MSDRVVCPACREKREPGRLHGSRFAPSAVIREVERLYGHYSAEFPLCEVCIDQGKMHHLESLLRAEQGEIGEDERVVLASIESDGLLTEDQNQMEDEYAPRSEQVALQIAAIVGSLLFPGLLALGLFFWIGVNVAQRPFEPYPMVVLGMISAVLGTLGALYGPIILIAQRVQRNRDRVRAANDYRINLKAELEIQYLTEQMEQLLRNQEEVLRERRK